ncbi:MAG: GDP-mannose 4,6-dehydratase [Verrucomicrobia bacterium]|nr:GDP-mannose 4,6-dehydratase [Verrucomicrobiota bacterium]
MRIFITGIAGFIGFHAAQALRQRGNAVMGCDNFNDYYDPNLKRKRAALLKQQGVEVVEMDIRSSSQLEKWIVDYKITHFLHLAAQAGVRHSIQHPESYVDNNLDGFVQVLEVIRRHPQIPFIYASSSSVYGLNKKIPFAETDPTDAPSNLYGATKKSNELIAHAYHHMFGLSATGLRFFTVYGPWGRPDMAYFSFTDAILKGKPIQIYNEGQMKRDFTYIDDIVAGILAAIDLSAPCEIFNLGNNQPEDVLHLVHLLEKYTGKTAIKKLLPVQPGEVPVTYADIAKSQKYLGFSPQISLEQGLQKFLAWYSNYFNLLNNS